ncbi:hypothetical protein [Paenibacillus agricola]|uniref:Uncharacterized protein n=1 Tax=Paenibacillus agricola TaxID=2716264 RepID=A0ABX0J8J4_9BACL|nr:hypothetical protein [Paenibacillus agricola]NHN31153.1 hypothetical protein [Paenibacillus agricola]
MTKINNAITVLADETLGNAVLREYTEVKRAAAVGERIKIIATDQRIPIGTIAKCTVADQFTDGSIDTDTPFPGSEHDGFIDAERTEYVVLTPSDVIRIDDKRYRLVERKANVGDTVLIVNAVNDARDDYGYGNGETYVVMKIGGECPEIWPDDTESSEIYLEREEYSVIEPLVSRIRDVPTEAAATSTPIDTAAIIAQVSAVFAETFAKVGVRLTQIERILQAKETPLIVTTPETIASFNEHYPTRDDVIERAKADIENVKTPWKSVDNSPQYFVSNRVCDVEFIVNRDKRTVVALLRWRYNGAIQSRGKSRCARGDVFNASIGRAVSLRRALGLEVPAEYTDAPQPTEPRVGDVLYWRRQGETYRIDGINGYYYDFTLLPSGEKYTGVPYHYGVPTDNGNTSIIDDSREEPEVSA